MILTGPEIIRMVELGEIEIDPFNKKNVNPASVDLTLGDKVLVTIEPDTIIDIRDPKLSFWERTIGPEGFVLKAGGCYLAHTVERIKAEQLVPVLDGKSSLGRIFLPVHMTAGYGEPGFDGQYTLEIVPKINVRVFAGIRICQIRFHETKGEILSYQSTGRYINAGARGPVPSKGTGY